MFSQKLSQTTELINTSEQSALFELFSSTNDNIMINACAGSGKSYACREIAKLSDKPSRYIVFNKDNATEAQTNMPDHSKASTHHSYCLEVLQANNWKYEIDKDKIKNFLLGTYPNNKIINSSLRYITSQVVSLMKNTLNYNASDVINNYFYDRIKESQIDQVEQMASHAFQWSINDTTEIIDFDDMIFYPVHHKLEPIVTPLLLLDEAQDFNNLQLEQFKMIYALGNIRVVTVGDINQSLYEWRGASGNAMPYMQELTEAKLMDLSVTFRVPRTGVKQVNERYSHIKFNCLDNAIDGNFESIYFDTIDKNFCDIANKNNIVLARRNHTVVNMFLNMIKYGYPCQIKGTDIGRKLQGLIYSNVPYNENKLSVCESKIYDFLEERIKTSEKNDQLDKVIELESTKTCLRMIIDSLGPNSDKQNLLNKINSLFIQNKKTNTKQSTFMTIHKAKGLEADNVLTVSELISNSKHEQQEINCQYVRDTRHKLALTEVKMETV